MRRLPPTGRPIHWLACLLVFSWLLAGCGPGRGNLSGTVTFNKKPLASGSVVARGSDGITKGGPISPDGTYEIKDVGAGEITLIVSSPDPGEFKHLPRKKDEAPPPKKDRSKWFAIPERYGDFERSGLIFQLKAGANATWDIDLQ